MKFYSFQIRNERTPNHLCTQRPSILSVTAALFVHVFFFRTYRCGNQRPSKRCINLRRKRSSTIDGCFYSVPIAFFKFTAVFPTVCCQCKRNDRVSDIPPGRRREASARPGGFETTERRKNTPCSRDRHDSASYFAVASCDFIRKRTGKNAFARENSSVRPRHPTNSDVVVTAMAFPG